ncbi:MAG: hypothetical protein WBQ89_12415 [Candidatus Acidiferrum sp.]
MKFVQRLLLLAGALFACQFSVGTYRTAAAAANNEPAGSAGTKVASQRAPVKNAMLIHASSNAVSTGCSVAKTITISMPAESRPESIQVVLNGKDVTGSWACSSAQYFCRSLAWMPDGMQRRLKNLAANPRLADDPGDCGEWNDDEKHAVNPELAVTLEGGGE